MSNIKFEISSQCNIIEKNSECVINQAINRSIDQSNSQSINQSNSQLMERKKIEKNPQFFLDDDINNPASADGSWWVQLAPAGDIPLIHGAEKKVTESVHFSGGCVAYRVLIPILYSSTAANLGPENIIRISNGGAQVYLAVWHWPSASTWCSVWFKILVYSMVGGVGERACG